MAAIKVHDVVLVPCRVLAVDQNHGERSYLVAPVSCTNDRPALNFFQREEDLYRERTAELTLEPSAN